MKINKIWFRRRWLDGRYGHTNYLIFSLTIINFVLILYRFLIEQDPIMNEFLSDLGTFTLILMIFYVPISILIGYWHRHTQLSTENTIKQLENPLHAHICRIILDSRTGRASENEIIELKTLLSKIENNK
jgi:hypothetical protein